MSNIKNLLAETTLKFTMTSGATTTTGEKLTTPVSLPATSRPVGMIHADSDFPYRSEIFPGEPWMDEYNRVLVCADCGRLLTRPAQPGGTGFGTIPKADDPEFMTKDGNVLPNMVICYDCCGKRDLYSLQRAQPGDKFTFYLTKEKNGNGYRPNGCWIVTNWPGTWKQVVFPKFGSHNFAGIRRDVWFSVADPDSGERKYFHGVQYGDDSEICRVQCIKYESYKRNL